MGICHGKHIESPQIQSENQIVVAGDVVGVGVGVDVETVVNSQPNSKPSSFPFYSPSPLRGIFKSSPANSSVNSTPFRIFKRPFPPPSPAKHIKALLARRHGSVKPNEASIPENECEVGLDKNFGYSKQFGSKYELGEEVGRGHFGYTCAATAKKGELKGQEVAVKVIPKAKMTTAIAIEDVRREVKILRALTGHKNLVQFYDAFEDEDNVYIAMELCNGGELLDKILARGGKYSEEDAKVVMFQILSVVSFCHLQGVVHRDLKPENFLFSSKEEGSPLKAIDFGLSDFVKPDERLNDIVGSAYYVAPEVLHRAYGTEADMWSIGVIAYILLCGSRPFWARTESGIFRAVLKADPSFEEAPWPSLSSDARDFVKGLLNKDYRKRLTASQALSHPWLSNNQGSKIPLDIVVYKFVKIYICSSPLRKSALGPLTDRRAYDDFFEDEEFKFTYLSMFIDPFWATFEARHDELLTLFLQRLQQKHKAYAIVDFDMQNKFGGDVIFHIMGKLVDMASSEALAKTLEVSQLAYLREQFTLLGPNKSGFIYMQNFKTALMKNSTDAMKDSRVIDYANMVSSLQYRKLDFEEYCAAAISVYQLEGSESWEQHARRAYELFDKDGNRPIMIEELASELGLSPSVPVHVVLQDWIRHSDGKLSFLGFVRLLHGLSSRSVQKS
ncbi:hypothetical protein GIB67_019901 [Kingdonia uniflora]|uniref:Protein kinase domain-containing protein n=1 Tax=Kingdonia uniflora TaxID=39325 RepID=A0A7J7MKC8_9MAGN|nr:hypothetical protein GIB67_019901 [Kingdonia uniflora]